MVAPLGCLAAFFDLGNQPGVDFSFNPPHGFCADRYRLGKSGVIVAGALGVAPHFGVDGGAGKARAGLYLLAAKDGKDCLLLCGHVCFPQLKVKRSGMPGTHGCTVFIFERF